MKRGAKKGVGGLEGGISGGEERVCWMTLTQPKAWPRESVCVLERRGYGLVMSCILECRTLECLMSEGLGEAVNA